MVLFLTLTCACTPKLLARFPECCSSRGPCRASARGARSQCATRRRARCAGRFGDGTEEASRLAEAFFAGDARRKQGCVPDIDLEVHEVVGIRIVEKPTLYELKQINLRAEYFR